MLAVFVFDPWDKVELVAVIFGDVRPIIGLDHVARIIAPMTPPW